MSSGQLSVPIVFRGPNGAAAGVGAQHSHVQLYHMLLITCLLIYCPYALIVSTLCAGPICAFSG